MTNLSDNLDNANHSKRNRTRPLIPPATISNNQADKTTNSSMLGSNGFRTSRSSRQMSKGPDEPKQQARDARQVRMSETSAQASTKSRAPTGDGPTTSSAAPAADCPSSGEVWSSVDQLFWDHIKEVENKWNTLKLNDDIWAKLIYFERNRRLAKAYVSAPILTVDGSTNGLDGFRIGLSGIDNNYRNLDSIGCLRSIGQGIKLKIDSLGNILIRKLGRASSPTSYRCSVLVKDWPSTKNSAPSNRRMNSNNTKSINSDLLLDDAIEDDDVNCMTREIRQSDPPYKLFDMRKFRLQLERRRLNGENFMDWRQCVSIISFEKTIELNHGKFNENLHNINTNTKTKILSDPCWLMIINIIAIDMLKNSICDRDSFNEDGSSVLIHDHSILMTDSSSNGYKSSPATGFKHEPLRSSSSASILYPSKHQNVSTSDVCNPLVADEEKIKKLRVSRYGGKLPPIKGNPNYRRHYQSTQQISSSPSSATQSNNTIYTTFNSKFINTKSTSYPVTDTLSTSDYHSASRNSTSSHGYWNHRQPPASVYRISSPYQQSLSHRGGMYRNYNKLGQVVDGPTTTTRFPSEPKNKTLSQSTFELSPGRRDFLPIQSSIKMNYDYGADADGPIDQDEGYMEHSTSRKAILSLNSDIPSHGELEFEHHRSSGKQRASPHCCEITDQLKRVNRDNPVNHNECQAIQGSENVDPKLATAATVPATDEQLQLEVLRPSIASSSSSSGCADNDYFMSHSSSSMSSSTRSNEMFSQQASSSGIVCSDNTSDECNEGRDVKQVSSGSASGSTSRSSGSPVPKNEFTSDGLKKLQHDTSDSNRQVTRDSNITKNATKTTASAKPNGVSHNHHKHRRGYKVKTIEPVEFCCDPSICEHESGCGEVVCDCAPVDFDCDCCCDCPYDTIASPPPPMDQLVAPDGIACDCGDDSIYSRLARPSSALSSNWKPSKKTIAASGQKPSRTMRRSGSWAKIISPLNTEEELSNIKPMSVEQNNKLPASSKSGWLERRKYMNLLPKFMFSNSNRVLHPGQKNGASIKANGATNLDEGGKFCRSRSTQNLCS